MLGLWCCMWVLGLGGAPHFSTQTDTRAQHLQFCAAWSCLDAILCTWPPAQCAFRPTFSPKISPGHSICNSMVSGPISWTCWPDACVCWRPAFLPNWHQVAPRPERNCIAIEPGSVQLQMLRHGFSTRPAKPKSHQLLNSTPCFRNCAFEPAALSSGMMLT